MCRFRALSHGVMVDTAVKAINHSFGKGIDPAKMITFQVTVILPGVAPGAGDH